MRLFKSIWFWLISIGVLLLGGNILVLCLIEDNELQGAWLTLISGWISGIATLIVGIIAYKQSKQYAQASLKQAHLLESKEFLDSFHKDFFLKFNIEDLMDINYQLYKICTDNLSKQEFLRRQLEINNRLIAFSALFVESERVLVNGVYDSDKLIQLHKVISNLSNQIDEWNCDNPDNPSTLLQYKEEYDSRREQISEFYNKYFSIVEDISYSYREFELRIINAKSSKEILEISNLITEAKKELLEYFKK